MTEIAILYEGDLHCHATHTPSGAVLQTDAPLDNQGRGENFSPTDLVATAMGSCMATLMGITAKRHNLDIRGTRVTVHKEMSKEMPRRIASLSIDCFVPLPSDHPQRKLLEAAALSCPVHHSLHPDIQEKIEFHYD